jgi:hypothetical protein
MEQLLGHRHRKGRQQTSLPPTATASLPDSTRILPAGLILKGHADNRDIDARKNIDRRAQCRERADEENEQGRHHKSVGPAQRDTDYSKHGGTGKRE